MDPFPVGVLQTVDAEACEPVNDEPDTCEPESATADPAVIEGVAPAVALTVTPSKLQAAITVPALRGDGPSL